MGNILAFSIIPMILLSPISGSVVDRFNRKHIMVTLDAMSFFVVLISLIAFPIINNKKILIGSCLAIFSIFSTFETPTVQACIPTIVEKKLLQKANAYVSQVHSVSNMVGPLIGAGLYELIGLKSTISICGVGFAIACIIEVFIKIPYQHSKRVSQNVFKVIGVDFKESFNYIVKERPLIFKLFLIIALYNLFITSMIHIGLPYILKIVLKVSSICYGITESTMGIGAIIGSVVVILFGKKIEIGKIYLLLIVAIVGYIPLMIINNEYVFVSYVVITIGIFLAMLVETIFDITMMSYIQINTPNKLMGKVFSLNMLIVLCAQPLGEVMFGNLFERFKMQTFYVVLFSLICGVIITIILLMLLKRSSEFDR